MELLHSLFHTSRFMAHDFKETKVSLMHFFIVEKNKTMRLNQERDK